MSFKNINNLIKVQNIKYFSKISRKGEKWNWILGLDFFHSFVILVGLTVGIFITLWPDLGEKIYVNFVFINYRKCWYFISENISFPILYLWLFWVVIFFLVIIKSLKNKSRPFWRILLSLILFLVAHVAYFYLSWGFNYFNKPIAERLEISHLINHEDFIIEWKESSNRLSKLRNELEIQEEIIKPKVLNDELRILVSSFLAGHQLAHFSQVNCKLLFPKGSLLIWATAGVYWPFSGESQIDAGLHPLEWPFTMAHELAHGMSWTDEGECNFIAYEACLNSENTFIKYSAELCYWKYLCNNALKEDQLLFDSLKCTMPILVFTDLEEIKKELSKYPDILPALRDKIYNFYLRSNKIHAGIKSYDEVIQLVINYKKKIGN